MNDGSAQRALPAARFLPTVVSDTRTDYWACFQCPATGEVSGSWESAPRVHTAETGHSTVIRISHTVRIEGVRY